MEPGSLDTKSKLASVALVGPAGADEMVVSGALVSTTTVTAFEETEVFPAGSVALAV
jgi:hypothetical protein